MINFVVLLLLFNTKLYTMYVIANILLAYWRSNCVCIHTHKYMHIYVYTYMCILTSRTLSLNMPISEYRLSVIIHIHYSINSNTGCDRWSEPIAFINPHNLHIILFLDCFNTNTCRQYKYLSSIQILVVNKQMMTYVM